MSMGRLPRTSESRSVHRIGIRGLGGTERANPGAPRFSIFYWVIQHMIIKEWRPTILYLNSWEPDHERSLSHNLLGVPDSVNT